MTLYWDETYWNSWSCIGIIMWRSTAKIQYRGNLELQNIATLYWEIHRAQYREYPVLDGDILKTNKGTPWIGMIPGYVFTFASIRNFCDISYKVCLDLEDENRSKMYQILPIQGTFVSCEASWVGLLNGCQEETQHVSTWNWNQYCSYKVVCGTRFSEITATWRCSGEVGAYDWTNDSTRFHQQWKIWLFTMMHLSIIELQSCT